MAVPCSPATLAIQLKGHSHRGHSDRAHVASALAAVPASACFGQSSNKPSASQRASPGVRTLVQRATRSTSAHELNLASVCMLVLSGSIDSRRRQLSRQSQGDGDRSNWRRRQCYNKCLCAWAPHNRPIELHAIGQSVQVRLVLQHFQSLVRLEQLALRTNLRESASLITGARFDSWRPERNCLVARLAEEPLASSYDRLLSPTDRLS